jgi:hypothetical protein
MKNVAGYGGGMVKMMVVFVVVFWWLKVVRVVKGCYGGGCGGWRLVREEEEMVTWEKEGEKENGLFCDFLCKMIGNQKLTKTLTYIGDERNAWTNWSGTCGTRL